jgi:hypothetical protein
MTGVLLDLGSQPQSLAIVIQLFIASLVNWIPESTKEIYKLVPEI